MIVVITLGLLAECARVAETGDPVRAAEELLRRAEDADASTVEAVMRYSALDAADAERFCKEATEVACVRVERLGEFWLAPLDCWAQLPSGACVISPRGLRALGLAVVEAMA